MTLIIEINDPVERHRLREMQGDELLRQLLVHTSRQTESNQRLTEAVWALVHEIRGERGEIRNLEEIEMTTQADVIQLADQLKGYTNDMRGGLSTVQSEFSALEAKIEELGQASQIDLAPLREAISGTQEIHDNLATIVAGLPADGGAPASSDPSGNQPSGQTPGPDGTDANTAIDHSTPTDDSGVATEGVPVVTGTVASDGGAPSDSGTPVAGPSDAGDVTANAPLDTAPETGSGVAPATDSSTTDVTGTTTPNTSTGE
jgi:hypothetical protein